MVAVVVVEVLVLVVVVAVAVVVVVLALVLMLAGVVQGIADIGLLTRFKVLNGVLWGVTVVVLTKLLELTSVVVVVADEVVVVVVIIVDVVVAVVVACACIVGAERTQCLEWAHDHTHKLAKTATELALCIEPLAHSSSFGAQS